MKFYILCDIEGVASLACWDEARSANACYAPMAREMALEAAAAARGLFSGGVDDIVTVSSQKSSISLSARKRS